VIPDNLVLMAECLKRHGTYLIKLFVFNALS
jgi:hypothetical protein